MINIQTTHFKHIGSHYKNSRELTHWLADQKRADGQPKYNITAFVYSDNEDFEESENFHLLKHPLRRDSLV